MCAGGEGGGVGSEAFIEEESLELTLHEATGVGQIHWVEEKERGSHAEEPAHAKHKGANIQGHPKGD